MFKYCISSCSSELELQPLELTNFPSTQGSASSAPDWDSSSILGRQIAPDHEQEWCNSAVDPVLIRLNVQTLVDTAVDPYGHEMVYPIAERLNWQVKGRTTKALRGWWVSGVDPLNNWQPMAWGRFKPDAATPIFDREKGKPAKYLSPSLGQGSSRLVLLDVPLRLWQRVADRYGHTLSRADLQRGFWPWVWQSGVPIILTEGEKKAGCLLTAGYAAIALPGIFGGYRRQGNQLIPELAYFATPGRTFYICFDYEAKAPVLRHIFLATARLGQLLCRCQCGVKVMLLSGPEKGVDDFVVARGEAALAELYQTAQDWARWQSEQLWGLTQPVALSLNQPYLEAQPYPDAGLVLIKSPKGTGKTTALQSQIRRAIAQDRKVLVITHRIQLGKAICQNLGISWIDQIDPAQPSASHGLGLCIDSLHPNSQAKFDPYAWEGAIVILDEVEQVLWHALNSRTCANVRVKVLETLKELVEFVVLTGGLIIAQDADLSDVSVEYLQRLVPAQIDPWILVNQWDPHHTIPTTLYDTKTPAALLSQLPQILEKGAVFIALDSQKVNGRWSSKNLETYLRQQFPHQRILRIDSETVADPHHVAHGIARRINEVVSNYDIVLATPTIGTGVSIDIKGHFQAICGIFQGVIADSEARQALARVRDAVPRLIWGARFGPGKVGNGSCFYRDIAQSTAKVVKYNIMLLREVDFDLDQQSDPIALRTWAKMAARVNLSLWQFRESLRQGLLREGYPVTVVTDDPSRLPSAGAQSQQRAELLSARHDLDAIEVIQQAVTKVRSANRQAEALAVADSPELEGDRLSPPVANPLAQPPRTKQQHYSKRKQELQDRYPIQITPELTLKDEQGWYNQLLLHYYVIHDPLFVQLRDLQEWRSHLERGNGKVALQDVQLLTAQVEMLKVLGVVALLHPEDKIRVSDASIEHMLTLGQQYRQDIRLLFNIRLTEKTPSMTFVQGLLAKLDLRLTCIGRDRAADGRRGGLRVYRYFPPEDDRETIFAEWRQRDEALLQAQAERSRPSQHPEADAVAPHRRFVSLEARRSA